MEKEFNNDKCECNECNCEENCECNEESISDLKKDKKNSNKKDKRDKKIEELELKVKFAANEVLTAKADLINYRKRKDEEVIKMLKYSNEDLVKELLPIVDTFERAIKMDNNEYSEEVSKFLEGFKMIYCNTVSILEKYGVKAIDGSNKVFDPAYHQAVMTEKKDDMEPGMVIEVLQKGYLLKDKVIRPAMVRVSE